MISVAYSHFHHLLSLREVPVSDFRRNLRISVLLFSRKLLDVPRESKPGIERIQIYCRLLYLIWLLGDVS